MKVEVPCVECKELMKVWQGQLDYWKANGVKVRHKTCRIKAQLEERIKGKLICSFCGNSYLVFCENQNIKYGLRRSCGECRRKRIDYDYAKKTEININVKKFKKKAYQEVKLYGRKMGI